MSPFKFLSVGTRPIVEDVPVEGVEAFYDYPGEEVSLRDMNGDGWTDIVEFDSSSGNAVFYVHLRRPSRGAGWEAPQVWGVFVEGMTLRVLPLGLNAVQGRASARARCGFAHVRPESDRVVGYVARDRARYSLRPARGGARAKLQT